MRNALLTSQILGTLIICFCQLGMAADMPVHFQGGFSNRYDKVYNWSNSGTLVLTDHFTMQGQLQAESQLDSNLFVAAQVSVSQYWNSWLTQNRPESGDKNLQLYQKNKDQKLYFTKMYFDYHPLPVFSFMGGRLPTADGKPTTYYKGKTANAIYPKLAYGSALDGMIASAHSRQPNQLVVPRLTVRVSLS